MLLVFGWAAAIKGQEPAKPVEVPHFKTWLKVIEKARTASSVSYRGLCLYQSHISGIECKGGKDEVAQVLTWLESQKIVESSLKKRSPVGTGIGGVVRFYDDKGNEVTNVAYLINDLVVTLNEETIVLFVTANSTEKTFFSDDEALPFVYFGKAVEKSGWKELRVLRKMKEIHEYRESMKEFR